MSPTILKLLADLGTACAKYKLRNLPCLQSAKDKNLPEELKRQARIWQRHPSHAGRQ
jgi:hypothetical protein